MTENRGRPLALRCSLVPGASFVSYLERLCACQPTDLCVTLSAMLSRCGIQEQGEFLPNFGVILSPSDLERVAAVTLNTPAEISATLLSSFDGLCLQLPTVSTSDPRYMRLFSLNNWVHAGSSALCPLCMSSGAEAWLLEWKLPWTFMCLQHGTYLIHQCPQCEERLGSLDSGGSNRSLRSGRPPALGRCRNTLPQRDDLPKAICDYRVMDIATASVTSERLFEAQRLIHTLLDGEPLDVAGVRTAPVNVFQHLRSVVSMMLHVADTDVLGPLPPEPASAFTAYTLIRDTKRAERATSRPTTRGPAHASYRGTPKDPLVMAAALPYALDILTAATPLELQERLWPLAQAAVNFKGNTAWVLSQDHHFEGELAAGFAAILSTDSRSSFRLRLKNIRSDLNLDVDYIPSYIDQEAYNLYFKAFFEGTDLSDEYGRSLIPIKLAQLTTSLTRLEAVEALGLPITLANGLCNKAAIHLKRIGKTSDFEDELVNFAQYFYKRSNSNYGEVRRKLSTLKSVPKYLMKQHFGIDYRVTSVRRTSAAAYIWSALTEGNPFHSPALYRESGFKEKSRRLNYYNFIKDQGDCSNLDNLAVIYLQMLQAGIDVTRLED